MAIRTIRNKSNLTGKINEMEIDVTDEQIQRWQDGELIQNVMPHLNKYEREFLISGATKEEWIEIFGHDE